MEDMAQSKKRLLNGSFSHLIFAFFISVRSKKVAYATATLDNLTFTFELPRKLRKMSKQKGRGLEEISWKCLVLGARPPQEFDGGRWISPAR